jgi:hypothetical protein
VLRTIYTVDAEARKMKRNILFSFTLICVGILLPASLNPNLFVFKPFGLNEVTQLLTFLSLIALFLERSIEVFITTWRKPREDKFDSAIQFITDSANKSGDGNESKLEENSADLEKINQQKAEYKFQTKKIALWTALFIGILISGVGIRSLETLIDLKKIENLDPKPISYFYNGQVYIFHILDTLLTGGLIAGGSDGIHQLTKLVTTFFEKPQNQTQNKG